MTARTGKTIAVAAATAALSLAMPAAANATIPAKYQSCTNLHRYYPHGVGRVGARDHVAAGTTPVTSWTRSTAAYNLAMHYNRGLDRDHDYIACERR